MRLAYKVWSGIAATTFSVLALADGGGTSTATSAAVVRPVPTPYSTYSTYPPFTTSSVPAPALLEETTPTSTTTTRTTTSTTTAPTGVRVAVPDLDRPPTRRPGAAATPAAPRSTRSSGGGGSYANCSAAKAAGAAPLHRGQPGYASKLDRDGDGVACER